MEDLKQVLALSVRAGELLLRNGGEIFRVQETMTRVAAAYGATSFQVYVLSNGIFACVEENGIAHGTQLRWVPLSPVHLGRVCAINNLSREIVQGRLTLNEAFQRLEEIQRIPSAHNFAQVLASGVGSACFCYIFGGSFADALAALIAGAVLWLFLLFVGKRELSKIITNLLGSALVALCGLGLFTLGVGNQIDRVIIGAIVPLLPGVPLTTAIRDFFNGDYLSGTIRIIDALLIGCCIAMGVGFVLKVWSLVTGAAI